jgi:tRNA dimethylallyltransferase
VSDSRERGPGTTRRPIAVLTGPTGTGKTDFALALAREFPIEIVSVDSAQVYRGLDIGSAKPTREIRAQVPHHLVDLVEPTESYSAGQFVRDAARAVEDIESRGRIPLLVGGTMLYLRALTAGIAELPEGNATFRAGLDAQAAVQGWPAMHARLAGIDPAAAARIHPNDAQRIQRALEVHAVEGRPISELHRSTTRYVQRDFRIVALIPGDRPRLHAALDERFGRMMAAGFLEEVRSLYQRGDLTDVHPAIRAVGYRQLWAHLAGSYSLDIAVSRAVAATRQLAKRQMTWLRSMSNIHALDPYDAHGFVGIRDALVGVFCPL